MKSRSKKHKARRKSMMILIVALAVCLFVGMFCFLRRRSDKAVAIKPIHEIPAEHVAAYSQKDSSWKEDTLGLSGFHMGGSGCLTTCIASALSTQAQNSGTGSVINPGELNKLFGEQGVYNTQGDIVWKKLEEALPNVGVEIGKSIEERQIDNLLLTGRYPIVKVKVGGYGASHWVLLVGSEGGEYLCMDPLETENQVVPLSRHGGVVYRMRCVYWEK